MDIQPVQAPAPVAEPVSHKRFIITIIGVVVLIAILAGGYFFINAKKGITVFDGDYLEGTVHEFGLFGYKDVTPMVSGYLSDYARAGKTKVAVVLNESGTAQDIAVLSDAGRMLTTDGAGKAALAVSPDGTEVAYAVVTGAPAGTLFDIKTVLWSVRTTNLETGDSWTIGEGFGPQYFERDGKTYLLFTSSRGIVVADLEARTTQTTLMVTPGVVDYTARISADGMYLAMENGVTKKTDLYTVKSIAAPLSLELITAIEPELTGMEFIGDTLYGVQWDAEGARVWSVTPDGVAQKVHDLPEGGLHRIIR